MKNKALYGALLILGLIALSGCVSQKNYANGEFTTTEGNSYYTTPAVTINDPELKKADTEIKPILEETFGGAKPVSVLNLQSGKVIVYLLPRKITQSDYKQLTNEIINQGYNITVQNADNESFGFVMMKDDFGLLVGGNFNKDKISVSVINLT